MADPITTVVTVISEHPQAAATVASIYGVAKPFLAKILGPGAEELGEIGRDYIKGRRAKNTERTLAEADNLLAATGREPQEVPLDIAVPLLEGASLQEDPTLAEKWAALLANAADPAQHAPLQPGFTEVLRQLTSTDAHILEGLYAAAAGQLDQNLISSVASEGLMQQLSINVRDMGIGVDNLIRLRLCKTIPTYGDGHPDHSFSLPAGLLMTTYGYRFWLAVTPPKV